MNNQNQTQMNNRCGRKTEVYSRVCGYLRPVKYWNKGKYEEFKDRKVFNISTSEDNNERNYICA